MGRAGERKKQSGSLHAGNCRQSVWYSSGRIMPWQRKRRGIWCMRKKDVCWAELRCSTTTACGCPLARSLACFSLVFPTLRQAGSQPASASLGRRREIARQCALARRRAVCTREQTTRTQTYLADTLLLQCCCDAAATLMRIMPWMPSSLHSARPACSPVCSYADVPGATGRWRAWPAIAEGCYEGRRAAPPGGQFLRDGLAVHQGLLQPGRSMCLSLPTSVRLPR